MKHQLSSMTIVSRHLYEQNCHISTCTYGYVWRVTEEHVLEHCFDPVRNTNAAGQMIAEFMVRCWDPCTACTLAQCPLCTRRSAPPQRRRCSPACSVMTISTTVIIQHQQSRTFQTVFIAANQSDLESMLNSAMQNPLAGENSTGGLAIEHESSAAP